MKHEKLLKEIDELIVQNRDLRRGYSISSNIWQMAWTNNVFLGKIKDILKDADNKEYERGADDAWELAKKVALDTSYCYGAGAYDSEKLRDIFGIGIIQGVMINYTGTQALARVEAYEQKKKEEEAAAKIVVGDIVKHSNVHGVGPMTFIVTKISDKEIKGIRSTGETCTFVYPNENITKTGKHVDLEGLFEEMQEG